MSNKALNSTKYSTSDTDSWFTTPDLIHSEISHYMPCLKDKIVLCNANDPVQSAFTSYFINNFHSLQLKRLISVSYIHSKLHSLFPLPQFPQSYVLEYDGSSHTVTPTTSGDFRDPLLSPLWKMADVVVTNPPFSLFREFFELLISHHKQFLVLSNLHAVTYNSIFPHIQDYSVHLGYNAGNMFFRVLPDSNSISKPNGYFKRIGTGAWLTNLPVENRPPLILTNPYSPECYPFYDNTNVIHVDKVANIPLNYPGTMGVPITFLKYFTPDLFTIVGKADHGSAQFDLFVPFLNRRKMFKRILIKHNVPLTNVN